MLCHWHFLDIDQIVSIAPNIKATVISLQMSDQICILQLNCAPNLYISYNIMQVTVHRWMPCYTGWSRCMEFQMATLFQQDCNCLQGGGGVMVWPWGCQNDLGKIYGVPYWPFPAKLSFFNHAFHDAGPHTILCCKNPTNCLVAMGIKGEKTSQCGHHHPLTSTLLSTWGACLKWRCMRVGGSIPPNSSSVSQHWRLQIK